MPDREEPAARSFAREVAANAMRGLLTAACLGLLAFVWRLATGRTVVSWESLPVFTFRLSPSWILALVLLAGISLFEFSPKYYLLGSRFTANGVAASVLLWPCLATMIACAFRHPRPIIHWWDYTNHFTNWIGLSPAVQDTQYFTSILVFLCCFGFVAELVGQAQLLKKIFVREAK